MRLRLYPLVLAVLAYNLATSVRAWVAGWPPQLGGNPDPEQSYPGYLFGGSAISAPLPPLIALVVGALLLGRTRPWRIVGLFVIGIVSVLFIIGAVGEFFADHPHVPLPVVYGFGGLALLLALTMLFLVSREVRSAARPGTDE